MRLRHYMMVVGLPAFALALLSLAAFSRLFLLPRVQSQDALGAQQYAQRAASAVAQDLSSMEGITTDWAWWDESYQAAQDSGEAFTQANLIDSTFINLQINLIMLLDAKGEVVLARSFDLHSGQRVDVPQSLLAQINSANPLLPDLNAPPAAHSGLLLLPEGVLNLAAAPILPSSLEGPPAGTLVIGRWLDQDRLEYLSNLTGLPIEVLAAPNPADLSALGWQPDQKGGDFWSRTLDQQLIDGFAALQDIYGDRSVILRVRSSRQVYQNGVASLRFFTIGLASVLTLLSLVGMWLVDRKISKRLIEMSQRMEAINHVGGQGDPLSVQGRDEISGLASAFNAMLERIQRSENLLVESEQRMRMIVENLPVMVEALDADERIVFWNKECERVTGYSAEEILTRPRPLELLHPDQVYLNEMLQRSYADPGHRDMVWELTCKDGTVKSIAYSNISRQCPIPGWHEWAIGVDISEQEAALDALRKSERDFTSLVENSPDLIIRFDTGLRHIYANPAAEMGTGLMKADSLGKKASELPIPPENAAFIEESLRKALESGQEQVVQQDFPTPAGDVYFETRIVPECNPQGEIETLLAISRDVTGRVQAEQALARIAEINAALAEVSEHMLVPEQQFEQVAAFILSQAQQLTHSDHGYVSAANPQDGERVGVSFSALMQEVDPKNAAQTQASFTHHPPGIKDDRMDGFFAAAEPFIQNDLAAVAAPLNEVPHDHVPLQNMLCYPVVIAGETLGQIVLGNKPGGYGGEDMAIVEQLAHRYGMFLASTRMLAALRQSEERYRTFINSTTDLVFLKDSHLRHILVNTVYQQFFGIPEAEVVGKTDFELMPEAHAAACRASDLQTLESMDFTVSRETQGDREYETRKFPVRLGKGEIGVGAFIRDVTEQVRADGVIKAALEERTVLLREVQHRSKNNLQAMISLMQMRDEMIKDPDMHQLLLQLEEQARAMALVYEQLYHSESLSEVSMQAYLSQLVNNLTLVFETGYNIQLEIRALNAAGKPLALPANRAMPCGLIVNELVTNALKYAFPPGFAGRPQIRVEMSEAADGLICLQVADNGVGLTPGFDPKAQKSLGMRLVRLWATHQMDGEFEMQSPPGVQFTITFRNSE